MPSGWAERSNCMMRSRDSVPMAENMSANCATRSIECLLELAAIFPCLQKYRTAVKVRHALTELIGTPQPARMFSLLESERQEALVAQDRQRALRRSQAGTPMNTIPIPSAADMGALIAIRARTPRMDTIKTDAVVSRQRSRECLKVVAADKPTNVTAGNMKYPMIFSKLPIRM